MTASRFVLRLGFAIGLMLLAPVSVRARCKVIAYVPDWIDLRAFAQTIDYPKLTQINIAFANPVNDEGDLSGCKGSEFVIARAREKGVKVLASLGGGSASEDHAMRKRYSRLLGADRRDKFVTKLADFIAKHDFDGVDIDIEGPAITSDYGAFIADAAKALHAKHRLLTAAVAQGYGGGKIPDSVFEHLDLVNIMAYDGAGPWDPNSPGQHSSIPYAKENVEYWLKRGLPKSKAVLGVPFYGYGFGKAFRKEDYSYAQIVADYPGAENADQAGSTIWYNGIPTIKAKTKYVVDQGLAGVMIWSLDGDAKGAKSLLSAIHETLHGK